VRWWALETAFSACVATYGRSCDQAKFLVGQLGGEAASGTSEAAVGSVAGETSEVRVEDIVASLADFPALMTMGGLGDFRKRFDAWRAGQGEGRKRSTKAPQADPRKLLEDFSRTLEELDAAVLTSCDRLEDIRHSYTLYRDIVLTADDGRILANANPEERARVLGLDVSDETWYRKALETRNGTEYHAQDLGPSAVEKDISLVYATAVRESSNENGRTIGAMGVFFDFQGEAAMILEEYMPRDERGQVLEGALSMFTDSLGNVIASTDPNCLPPGGPAHLPRSSRNLESGARASQYIVFEGIESAVFSARTDGYLDYRGLGWSSHVIVPKSHLFELSAPPDEIGISAEELMDSRIIPDINKQTYLRVQDDKESIQLISLNGIVFASKLGKRGGALGPIFNQITRTGDFVTSRMEDLLKEMALGELELNLKALENFSKQAIDLVDRNLFERGRRHPLVGHRRILLERAGESHARELPQGLGAPEGDQRQLHDVPQHRAGQRFRRHPGLFPHGAAQRAGQDQRLRPVLVPAGDAHLPLGGVRGAGRPEVQPGEIQEPLPGLLGRRPPQGRP
jgi:hypothetical protein